jgi:hypothetical protein
MRGPLRTPIGGLKLRAIALTAGGLLFAYVLGNWILQGGFSELTLNSLGIILALIALTVVTRWRLGIYFFLAWLVFEDLPRKYLGNNMIVFFGKDALVAVVYVAYMVAAIRRQVDRFRPPFWFPLLLFTWLGVAQVFNPNSTSLFYGLLGLKLYFYYVPLMFLGYSLIRDEEDLQRFLSFNLVLATIVSAVGIIQALGLPNFMNPKTLAPELEVLGHLTRMSPLTHRILNSPASVFVSSGRFDSYIIMVFVLALGAAGYQLLRPTRRGRVVLPALGIIAVASLLSGSRGTVLYPVISTFALGVALLWGSRFEQSGKARLVKAVRRSLLAVSACILAMVFMFPDAVGASWSFYYETLSPESPNSELYYRVRDYPMKNFMFAFDYADWPMGYGIGSGSLGAQYVVHVLGKPAPPVTGIESGYGTLIMELGILGPFLWLFWTGALVVAGWGVVRRLLGTTVFPVAVAILWFAFLLLFPLTYGGLAPYQNYILNAYFWILVGILFRLPKVVLDSKTFQVAQRPPLDGPVRPGLTGSV